MKTKRVSKCGARLREEKSIKMKKELKRHSKIPVDLLEVTHEIEEDLLEVTHGKTEQKSC